MGWNLSPRNIIAMALAPVTAGTSLAFAEDSEGNTGLDYVTGAKSAREMERRQKAYQDETNQLSIDLANSAHQREVLDLQKAGLNPVLSAGGQGAITPQLGTAVAQNEMPGGLMAQATQAANIMNLASSAKQAQSTAELQEQQAGAIPSQIQLNQATAAKELTEAGYKDREIDYYMEHGVFPGATTTKSTGTPWGNSSETIPIGIKEPQNANSATKALNQRKNRDKLNRDAEKEIKRLHEKYGNWWY